METEQRIATLQGLHEWYSHTFKIAGWMVLARHRALNEDANVATDDERYEHKLKSFQGGIKRLCKHLTKRMEKSHGNGTVTHDFPKMIVNLQILGQFVEKLNNTGSDVLNENCNIGTDLADDDKTLHGLKCMYKRRFEKYGFIILAQGKVQTKQGALQQYYQEKINLYRKSLDVLVQSLQHRLNICNTSIEGNCKDNDTENNAQDLRSMIANVCVLINCFDKCLNGQSVLGDIGAALTGAVTAVRTALSPTSAMSLARTASPRLSARSPARSPARLPARSPTRTASPRLSARSPARIPTPTPLVMPVTTAIPARTSPLVMPVTTAIPTESPVRIPTAVESPIQTPLNVVNNAVDNIATGVVNFVSPSSSSSPMITGSQRPITAIPTESPGSPLKNLLGGDNDTASYSVISELHKLNKQ